MFKKCSAERKRQENDSQSFCLHCAWSKEYRFHASWSQTFDDSRWWRQTLQWIAKDKLHEHHQDLLGRERAANEADFETDWLCVAFPSYWSLISLPLASFLCFCFFPEPASRCTWSHPKRTECKGAALLSVGQIQKYSNHFKPFQSISKRSPKLALIRTFRRFVFCCQGITACCMILSTRKRRHVEPSRIDLHNCESLEPENPNDIWRSHTFEAFWKRLLISRMHGFFLLQELLAQEKVERSKHHASVEERAVHSVFSCNQHADSCYISKSHTF